MKPAAFDYARPTTLNEAAALLAQGGGRAKILAGGQSLGPMLNFRVVQPLLLIDVARIPELSGVEETADSLTIGAGVTHASIEDRRLPATWHGVLPSIAKGIAYRAVRNRGTIGGSLCHADPAADWLSTLTALDATILTHGAKGGRAVPIADFIRGAFTTALQPDELVAGIRIPRLSRGARWGWYKVCRKPGEFANAMCAILEEPETKTRRIVLGATGNRPIVLNGNAISADAAERALANSGLDRLDRHVHGVALRRALAMAQA